MSQPNGDLSNRVFQLERRLRLVYRLLVVLCIASALAVTSAFLQKPAVPDLIRTRQLVIEDGSGRDRVVLGAPIRDNFNRISPATGMAIRDSAGNERFGVALDERGNMGLGLDAPRCTSDPCNRERINLVADAAGGAHLRFLDRQTGVALRMLLDDDDRAYLEFLKVNRDSVRGHRLGLNVDTTFAASRR